MRYFVATVLVGLLGAVTGTATDPQAVNLCKTFHPDLVDENLTKFFNSKCAVNCYIRGYPWTHLLHENEPCPDNNDGVCHAGECRTKEDPSVVKLGHIDIEMASGSVNMAGRLYATVCIQNNTEPITFPMADRSRCAVCTTKTSTEKVEFFQWNTVCTGSSQSLWLESSRVTFEMFDLVDEAHGVYLGTSTLTIPQVLSNGDNNKKLHLPLSGAKIAGQINARITWTAV